MHPKNISIEDYTYVLPDEKIASHPLEKRDASKLLIYNEGNINEDTYSHIDRYIPENSLMVFNNTRVVEARLLFQKNTGGVIEIFCLEPHEKYPDITTAMDQRGSILWLCLVGGASKWKHGLILEKKVNINGREIKLEASYVEKRTDCFVIELSWSSAELSFAEVLHYAGKVPLPPYIKREVEVHDAERYQTVYARYDGSVAAPTAGLHFTNDVLGRLEKKGVSKGFVTLHVGAGTFKPVKANTMSGHEMHAEYIEVNKDLIERILEDPGRPIVAVGTTSLRTLESLYWFGCQLLEGGGMKEEIPFLTQWEAYDMEAANYSIASSLSALLKFLGEANSVSFLAKTQIIIAPGYQFKIVKGLVTNFHQPNSTLLLLVAAFIGDDWRRVYNYALHHNFRFLSYGDGNLFWRE